MDFSGKYPSVHKYKIDVGTIYFGLKQQLVPRAELPIIQCTYSVISFNDHLGRQKKVVITQALLFFFIHDTSPLYLAISIFYLW